MNRQLSITFMTLLGLSLGSASFAAGGNAPYTDSKTSDRITTSPSDPASNLRTPGTGTTEPAKPGTGTPDRSPGTNTNPAERPGGSTPGTSTPGTTETGGSSNTGAGTIR